jgi:hypothetical protein
MIPSPFTDRYLQDQTLAQPKPVDTVFSVSKVGPQGASHCAKLESQKLNLPWKPEVFKSAHEEQKNCLSKNV